MRLSSKNCHFSVLMLLITTRKQNNNDVSLFNSIATREKDFKGLEKVVFAFGGGNCVSRKLAISEKNYSTGVPVMVQVMV